MHEPFILDPGDGPGRRFMHAYFILATEGGPGQRFMHESFILAPVDGPGKRFMHESFIILLSLSKTRSLRPLIMNGGGLSVGEWWRSVAVGEASPSRPRPEPPRSL